MFGKEAIGSRKQEADYKRQAVYITDYIMVEDRREKKRNIFCVQRTQFYKTWKNEAVPTTDPFMVSI